METRSVHGSMAIPQIVSMTALWVLVAVWVFAKGMGEMLIERAEMAYSTERRGQHRDHVPIGQTIVPQSIRGSMQLTPLESQLSWRETPRLFWNTLCDAIA